MSAIRIDVSDVVAGLRRRAAVCRAYQTAAGDQQRTLGKASAYDHAAELLEHEVSLLEGPADPAAPKPGDVFVNSVGYRFRVTAVGEQMLLAVREHPDPGRELVADLKTVARTWKPAPAEVTS